MTFFFPFVQLPFWTVISYDLLPGLNFAGVRADAEKLIEETCHANISKLKSNKSRPINRKSLSELFLEFLEKVNNNLFDYVIFNTQKSDNLFLYIFTIHSIVTDNI